MKFLNKINRQYLLTLAIILLILSVAGYFLLRFIIVNEIKEDILKKEFALVHEIQTQNNLINIYPNIETKKITKSKIEHELYKEVYLMDESEGETEPYLEYTNSVEINNQWYLIKIRHSLFDTDDLVAAISIPLLLLLILSFSLSFFITKKLNKTVWKDFEENLKQIETFSFKNTSHFNLQNTEIEEFDRLNEVILKMTEKLKKDYFSLKEFTENASHELQTPLSIVLLNLEELLQQNLSKIAFKQVVSSINAIKRLASLNQNLILLTKIENRQFKNEQPVSFSNLVKNKVEEFTPLIEAKNLKTELSVKQDFILKINEQLAEILISNLLSNAVNHNIANGNIKILINNNELKICNTGEEIIY
ncbi:MAG: HAMP domain-containing histidine kinase [Chlorobi bacterium]|nr:HAMP domain-containing histidine kinase [Chlorobiota bacterium]